jgi:site-specific DNA recombinase
MPNGRTDWKTVDRPGDIRAAIYARISRVERKREIVESIEEQIAECQLYADDHGLTVVGIFKDNLTASGFSTKDRPDFRNLMGMVRAGQVDVILVTEQSRLDRKLWNVLELVELARTTPFKRIIRVRDDDDVDLSSENGINRTIDQANRDRHESALISQRAKAKKKVRARRGEFNGGNRPYAYKVDGVTVRESEARVVRAIAAMLVQGRSLRSICAELNAKNVTTSKGQRWQVTSVRVLMQSKRLIGIRVHNGSEYPAAWPAILDVDTWEQVQRILAANSRAMRNRTLSRNGKRPYLLTGFLVCSECGSVLTGHGDSVRKRQPKRHRYYCRKVDLFGREVGCGKVSRIAEPLEALITDMVIRRFDAEGLGKAFDAATEGTEMAGALHDYRTTKDALGELLSDFYRERNKYARDEMAKLKAQLETELAAVTARMGQIESTRALASIPIGRTMRESWQTADLDLRRAFIELAIEKVIVKAGRTGGRTWKDPNSDHEWRFDYRLIEIVWRA